MTEIKPYLQRIVDRFADPDVQKTLSGFKKTIQFRFTDTEETWVIHAVDGKQVSMSDEPVAEPDISIIVSTDILAGIMDKNINGTTAFMQRKIRVKGTMEDLMRMQKLML